MLNVETTSCTASEEEHPWNLNGQKSSSSPLSSSSDAVYLLVLFGGSESLRLVFSLSSSRFLAPLMFFASTFPAASPFGRDPLLVILLVTARRPALPELEWSRCRSHPGSPSSMCPFQSISNAKKSFVYNRIVIDSMCTKWDSIKRKRTLICASRLLLSF